MTTTDVVVDDVVERFRTKTWNEIKEINMLVEWCVELYEVTKIKPPYTLRYGVTENLTCYEAYKRGEDPVLDIEKTQVELAKVIQFARLKKYEVEKKYTDSEFMAKIKISENLFVRYFANRKSVCKPKVTKKVTIPAREVEEVVEWDCSPIAFTKIDAGAIKPELNS